MKVYKTTPWFIEFDSKVLYNLCDYAVANGFDSTELAFIEDSIDQYFGIQLDYNEEKHLYVIYFDSDAELTVFKIKYSELL